MDISRYFKLKKTQAELDFVNVDPMRDIPLFVDPYALEIKNDEWSANCADDIRSFFTAVVNSLPVAHGKAVILVPKYSVRKKLSLDSQEFYNHHMIEFLKEEYTTPSSGLAYALKSGRLKVNKKDVKARHPFIKDDLADFVSKHPEVLEKYKDLKGAQGPLSSEELDGDFDERIFAEALIKTLQLIAPGAAAAGEYHSFMIGVLSFLFFPGLICPIKEHEIHSGRKRIDIRFTNAGDRGFFQSILQSPQTRALSIPVECKNYSSEIANPELDQMTGRFGHTRGFFGIICCRTIDDKTKFIERCRDAALDSRGYVVPFDDKDIIQMLVYVSNDNRKAIETFLRTRFDKLIS